MKLLPLTIFSFIVLTTNAQQADSLKVDSNLYSHAVDSLVKYVLKKEKPSSIILEANSLILNTIPNTIQGLEIIKSNKKRKIKAKNNSVFITVNPLGGTKTSNERSVFLVITKYNAGNRTSWEGYGGYNFAYIFDLSHSQYVLQGVSKSIIIR